MKHIVGAPRGIDMQCMCGDCPACLQQQAVFEEALDEDEVEREFLHRLNEAEDAALQRQLDGSSSQDDDDGDEEDPHGAQSIDERDESED